MSYEQFREQCAVACEQVDALWAIGSNSSERATPEDCAAAVRALPLPDMPDYKKHDICRKIENDIKSTNEALRKENADLLAALERLAASDTLIAETSDELLAEAAASNDKNLAEVAASFLQARQTIAKVKGGAA